MRAWSATLLAALALGCCAGATAQQKKATPAPATFEVTGIVADANGPLASRVVRVGPLDAQGNLLSVRSLSGPSGKGMSLESTTDAQGRFSVTVARSLFPGTGEQSLGLRAYTDLGGGRMSTTYEVSVVKFDLKQDKVDVGRVVMQPLKARK
jgi:hypothetical protein